MDFWANFCSFRRRIIEFTKQILGTLLHRDYIVTSICVLQIFLLTQIQTNSTKSNDKTRILLKVAIVFQPSYQLIIISTQI